MLPFAKNCFRLFTNAWTLTRAASVTPLEHFIIPLFVFLCYYECLFYLFLSWRTDYFSNISVYNKMCFGIRLFSFVANMLPFHTAPSHLHSCSHLYKSGRIHRLLNHHCQEWREDPKLFVLREIPRLPLQPTFQTENMQGLCPLSLFHYHKKLEELESFLVHSRCEVNIYWIKKDPWTGQ